MGQSRKISGIAQKPFIAPGERYELPIASELSLFLSHYLRQLSRRRQSIPLSPTFSSSSIRNPLTPDLICVILSLSLFLPFHIARHQGSRNRWGNDDPVRRAMAPRYTKFSRARVSTNSIIATPVGATSAGRTQQISTAITGSRIKIRLTSQRQGGRR